MLIRVMAKGLLILLLLGFSVTLSSSLPIPSSLSAGQNFAKFHYAPELLKTGDIIFRRGNSMVSHIILSTDSKSFFSHAGIIQKKDNKVFVIHAVISEKTDDDLVRIEPLETFLTIEQATSAAVYRLREDKNGYSESAANIANSYVERQIPFDLDFDLKTTDKFYCTELVWRAYLEAGIDLVDGKFDYLSVPFSKGAYLLPSRLLDSHWLYSVFTLTPTE